MPARQILYKSPAVKEIKALAPQIRKRLGEKLLFYASHEDPLRFAEPLTKPSDAQYRFRIGDYRVLFDLENNNIVVVKVQHRGEVYRK